MSKLELKIPAAGFKALIFDLDGTLVDSMPAHFEAWSEALEKQGHPGIFPEEVFYAMGGRTTRDIVDTLNQEQGLNLEVDAVAQAKKAAYLKHLNAVKLIPEVAEVATRHRGKIPLAVASGGSREVVGKTLSELGIADWFDEVVTCTDVENGKPAPDIFLEAASRLGIDPKHCVVYEDAQPGIIAARAAGMELVTIPSPLPRD